MRKGQKMSFELKENLRNIRTLKLDTSLVLQLYCNEELSVYEISKRLNCSMTPIRRILFTEKIPPRNKKFTNYGIIKLRSLYLNKTYEDLYGPEKSLKIKEKLSKISKGIPKTKEHNLKNSLAQRGEKGNNWLGGKSFEPYTLEFNKSFKEAIKIRDGFMCLKCGMREEDSSILLKRKLGIHHIDYNKENTIKENCCVLCSRCNTEANTNRNSWTKFFQSLLAERYGYQYSEDGKIIINLNKVVEKI